MRHLHLFRLYLGLSLRGAAPVGAPLFFGIFVVACVLFGPTGMRAADAVLTMRMSLPLAAFLFAGWLVLALPTARLALVPPASTYLRWLPAPRAILYVSAGVCVLVVQLPWMILFGRGEGVFSGLTAGLAAASAHALLVARPIRIQHGLGFLALMIAAWYPRVFVAFPVALFAATIAITYAIDHAPEVSAFARGRMRRRSPVAGLAVAHFVYLLRIEPATLGRALASSILAGLILPLAARGHDLETPQSFGGLALVLAGVSLPSASSGIASAIIRSERAAAWLCDATGTTVQTRVFSSVLAGALLGAVAGAMLGLTASLGVYPASPFILLRLFVVPILFAIAVISVLVGLAREADASPQRGDRGMVNALVATFFSVILASLWGERALGVLLFVAVVFVIVAPRRAERLRSRRGVS